jgi:hypothetical protein
MIEDIWQIESNINPILTYEVTGSQSFRLTEKPVGTFS